MDKHFLFDKNSGLITHGKGIKGQPLCNVFDTDCDAINQFIQEGKKNFSVKAKTKDEDQEVLIRCKHFSGDEVVCEIVDDLLDITYLSQSLDDEISGDTLFSEVFEHSPIGLVLVDENTLLYKANRYIFSYFGMRYQEVKHKRFGNVFLCSVVSDSEDICGETPTCKNCQIRGGLTQVLSDRATLENSILEHDFKIGGRKSTKYFQLSASPVSYDGKRFALVSFVDVTKQIIQQKKLELLGFTDELTQISNRRYLNQMMTTFLEDKQFDSLNVAILDIDNFKKVNDTYGHTTGDDILVALADTLVNKTRNTDHVGRFGGEEFLVLLPQSDIGVAETIIERIRQEFKRASKALVGEEISFSCGIAHITNDFDQDSTHLVDLADKKLYEVKSEGKDATKTIIV